MEFNEKLKKLRTDAGLTQEQLAEKLYVSRTAVSKWESGRGYPNIDSLKAIAKTFHVSVDALIGGEEMITLAEEDKKGAGRRLLALLCGMLDCLAVLLLFLPVFGERGAEGVSSVALPALTGIGAWLKVLFIAAVGVTALNGACAVVLVNFDRPLWDRHRLVTGMVLSVLGTALFILTRQPYAGFFFFCLALAKGILVWRSR